MAKLTAKQVKYGQNLGMTKLMDTYQGYTSNENGFTDIFYRVAHNLEGISTHISTCTLNELKVTKHDGEYIHLLHIAAAFNNVEAIKILLAQGIEIDKVVSWNMTPLMFAAEAGAIDAAMFLIDKGANIQAANLKDETALMLSSKNGHKDLVIALIEKGVIDTGDAKGATALMLAARYSDKEMVEILIGQGANIEVQDNDGNRLIHYAALNKNDDVELFKYLYTTYPIIITDLGDKRRTALMYACMQNNQKIIEYIIDKNLYDSNDRDEVGRNAAHYLAMAPVKKDNIKLFEELYRKSPKLIDSCTNNRLTVSMLAAMYGNKEIIQYLISKGADIDAIDKTGRNLIHYSASNKHDDVELFEFLYNTYPLISNNTDSRGRTVLMNACENGNIKIVRYLIEHYFDIHGRDINQKQALHYAAKSHSTKAYLCIEALLLAGANANSRDKMGNTPLILICAGENIDARAVKCLVYREKGAADITLANEEGETAWNLALDNEDYLTLCILYDKLPDEQKKAIIKDNMLLNIIKFQAEHLDLKLETIASLFDDSLIKGKEDEEIFEITKKYIIKHKERIILLQASLKPYEIISIDDIEKSKHIVHYLSKKRPYVVTSELSDSYSNLPLEKKAKLSEGEDYTDVTEVQVVLPDEIIKSCLRIVAGISDKFGSDYCNNMSELPSIWAKNSVTKNVDIGR